MYKLQLIKQHAIRRGKMGSERKMERYNFKWYLHFFCNQISYIVKGKMKARNCQYRIKLSSTLTVSLL